MFQTLVTIIFNLKWRKDAAETRAQQQQIAGNYASTQDKQLTDVTEAVRDFKNRYYFQKTTFIHFVHHLRTNAVEDLRYQKQGQQRWNLFETHYQREKGSNCLVIHIEPC